MPLSFRLVLVAALVSGVALAENRRILATKFVNWAVDPRGLLPVLPPALPLGLGDDPDAVEAHDAETRLYDDLYRKGGWMRLRLEFKVMDDPFDASTTRQVLTLAAVLAGLYAWRLGTRRE